MPRRFSLRRAAAGLALGAGLLASVQTPAAGPPAPERAAALRDLVLQDCGSCHGLRLKGGLGPALTPEALRGRPPELLAATVLDGRPGTPMPPWRPFLTEAEARWIVEALRRGDFLER